jgi:hypothetical protein
MIKPIAIFVTSTAVTMTAIAAWDRGGTFADKAVLVAMSVVIVVAVHLLPAMSRSRATWLVWFFCLFGAIYGHLTFFTNSTLRAADARAHQSALAVGTQHQIDAAREALDRITARPVAVVAAELALSEDRRERAALREEIAQGKRADALLADLTRLSAVATTAQIPVTDPVTSRLAAVTGWNETQVAVTIGLTFSILLELIGALLWYEAMRRTTVIAPLSNGSNTVTLPLSNSSNNVTHPVTILRKAVITGECQKTVRGIREFLGCSQSQAMELRRQL